jgi:GNAT superfamily N-acetyltransferase
MECKILTRPADVAPYVQRVIAIGDQNKKELGFLPYSAYEELALRGNLWIAHGLEDREAHVLGYLAFGSRNAAARVVQLYIDPAARGHGIGKRLIEQLLTSPGVVYEGSSDPDHSRL